MDHITIGITGSDRIMKIADMFKETICHDCMAEGITSGTLSGYRKEWDINGEKAELSVEKLS